MTYLKNNIFFLAFLCVLPSNAMELSTDSGCSGLSLLPEDIVHNNIQPSLSLQDIGRLKQVSPGCNTLYDAEKACSSFNGWVCNSYACSILRNNYYVCTKALAHCARTKNMDLFGHWWFYHDKIRNKNVTLLLQRDYVTIRDQMRLYRRDYHSTETIQKRIMEHVVQLLHDRDMPSVGTVLSRSNLNVFTLSNYFRRIYTGNITKDIMAHACALNNSDFISCLCDGSIGGELLPYVMQYSSGNLVKELIEKDVLSIDVVDKRHRTPLHLAIKYNHTQAIILLLRKGINVNRQDDWGKTALHYAVEYVGEGAASVLLAEDRLDVFRTDKLGSTALDYVVTNNILASYGAQFRRRAIKRKIQKRISQDREDMIGKGYHKL